MNILSIKKIILTIFVLITITFFAGCGDNGVSGNGNGQNRDTTSKDTSSIESGIDRALIGTWEFVRYTGNDEDRINFNNHFSAQTTFNADGTARTYVKVFDVETLIEYSWSAKNGIFCHSHVCQNYSISGNYLNLYGEETVYRKINQVFLQGVNK